MTNWDLRFVELARHIALWSKDPSTKVGCVIVGPDREIRSTGYNGFPRGIADDDRLNDRSQKYPLICHGEENAITHAARIGVAIAGCTAYTTLPPCCRCSVSLIQAGVVRVVYPREAVVPDKWRDEFLISQGMLREASVLIECV